MKKMLYLMLCFGFVSFLLMQNATAQITKTDAKTENVKPVGLMVFQGNEEIQDEVITTSNVVLYLSQQQNPKKELTSKSPLSTTLIDPTLDGGFETATAPPSFSGSNWVAVNSSVDAWAVGAVPVPTNGTKCAYISSNGGVSWTYSQISTIQHLYYDVTIPDGESKITLTFKWKAGGEGSGTSDWDNMKVFWGKSLDIGVLTANTAVSSSYQVSGPGAINGMYKLNSASWNSESITMVGIPGSTYRLVFSWKSDISDIANPPCALDEVSLFSSPAENISSNALGGLWNSPATWVGGVIPVGDNVTIVSGSTVVVNQSISIADLTIDGKLQWLTTTTPSTTVNTLQANNITINSGGILLAHGTVTAGATVRVTGNFINDGIANFGVASALLQFNASSGTQTLGGSGTFIADTEGRGMIRQLFFTTVANCNITSTQDIVTGNLAVTSGPLNTNGKLHIDNTAISFGGFINRSIYTVTVNTMGAGYTSAPAVSFTAAPAGGTTATGVANWDPVTGTVRSITITNPGDGYRVAPTVTLSGGGYTTIATAVAALYQNLSATVVAQSQKSSEASITGGININSSQGVGSVFVTNGGAGYTSAPTVGFALPVSFINLVTNGGSGYTSAPTVGFVGGGGSGATGTAVVCRGQVVSVHITGGGTNYTSVPAITLTGGGGSGATAEIPVGMLPTATANIDLALGMVTSFNVTNPGYGYLLTFPTVTLTGGGFTTAASGATSRHGVYNLIYNWFLPAVTNPVHAESAVVPANRRIHAFTIANALGASFNGDVTLYGLAPLPTATTMGDINMGGYTLTFEHPSYTGYAGTAYNYVSNGSITFKLLGSTSSQARPFMFNSYDGISGFNNHLLTMGAASPVATTGSTITTLTGSIGAAPTGTDMIGTRTLRIQTNGLYGNNPTLRMNWNSVDALVADAALFTIAQATATSGPWTIRSVASGAGMINPAGGNRTTATTGVGPIVTTGNDYFGWNYAVPACPQPINLTANNIQTTSANLAWTVGGSETAWEFEYGLAPLPVPLGSGTPTNSNTVNPIGPLSSNTTYQYYVRAFCDPDYSDWTGPFTFTTPASIPFFDGFETGNTHNTAISGWIQEAVLGTNVWTANNSLTDYNRSPRTGSWNAFLRYSNTRWMFKAFELTGGVTYNFSMYARQDGPTAANSDITVSYGIAPNAASMTNTIVPATGIINGDYQEIAGSFMPGSSGTYYIGIRGFMNSTPWYISIDDISITEASSATLSWYNLQWPPSANISVYDNATVYAQCWESGVTEPDGPGAGIECWIGYNTANANDISDFASGWTWVAAAYNYGADDPGFNNDEYMADLGAAQGLDEGTYYYVSRFRYNNGPFTYGGYNGGAWDGINNVSGVLTVFCPSITTYPFYESFETSWPPACWTNLNWDDSKYGAARTGTKWAYSNTNGSQLTTGEFEIPGTGLYQFSFWYRAESATYPQDFEVFISTDGINFTTSIFKATGITNTTYKEVVYFLNAYSSSSVWFRFVGQYGTGGYAYGVCIDDVAVIESPATAVWTGALNNNWFAPGNWNTYVPGPNTDVTIPAGLTNYPTILSDPAYCNDVFFGSAAGSTATLLDNGLLTVYGTATVERYFSGNDPDWHLVSSPVSNALADVFMGMYLQSFDEATNSYAEIIDETTPLGVMEGYGLYSTLGATNTVSFNGALNLGTKNKGFTANGLGWNLIGNPFVSSINWEMVTIPANLSSEVHYIEAATGNDLSYVKGVGGSGSQYIPPMQGFFVSATGSGTLSVGNAQRSHAGANIFYKSSNPNLVVLNATNGLFNDEAWIHFNELAGAEHDGQFDAHKRISLSNPLLPQIFSYTPAGMKLSVNGLPEVQSVPVGFTVLQSGEFTISAIETGDFSELYLEDLFNGNITNLLSANYTFNYNQGDTENRFILHFAPLSVGDNLERNSTIWSYGNEVIVMVPDLTNGHVKVYNMMGQEVVSSGVTSGRNVITVPQPGNYVVTLISNEVVRAEKVVIK